MTYIKYIFIIILFCLNNSVKAGNIDSLLVVNKKASGKEKIDNYLQLSKAYGTDSIEQSFTCAYYALELSKEKKYRSGAAKALRILGDLFYYSNNDTKALEYWIKELAFSTKDKNILDMSSVYCRMADYYGDKENYYKADEYFEEAEQLLETNNFMVEEAKCYMKEGNLYFYKQRDADAAIESYRQALKIFEQKNHKEGVSESLLYIGEVHEAKNKPDLALEYYKEAYRICKSIDNRLLLAQIQKNLALAFQDVEKHEKAIQHFNEAYNLFFLLQDLDNAAFCLFNAGKSAATFPASTKAEDYYLESIELYQQKNNLGQLSKVTKSLSDYYYRTGNIELHKKYISLQSDYEHKIDMIDQEKNKMKETRAREEKEIKELLIKKEKALKKQIISQHSEKRYIFLFASLGIILIFGIILLFSRKKSKDQS